MKLLVLILTSSKLPLLERCYNSVVNQVDTNFEVSIKIVVNTLNDEYYQQVKRKYGKSVSIVRTKSNGRPGMGHNSCLNIFKHEKEYDFMAMIDGDDLFYPVAFLEYQKYIEKCPELDLLHLMLNDKIHYLNPEGYNQKSLKFNFILMSGFEDVKNWWGITPLKDPLKFPICDCKTPSRILLASRNIFNLTIPIEYSTNMELYDDMTAFISIYDAELRGELKSYSISNPNIYLYNSLNDSSMSYIFQKESKQTEDAIFRTELKKYKAFTKNGWNPAKMNYIDLPLSTIFGIEEKLNFCNTLVVDFEIKQLNQQINNLSEVSFEDQEKLFKKMIKYGFNNKENITTIIKYNQKKNNPNMILFYLFQLYNEQPSFSIISDVVNIFEKYNYSSYLEHFTTIYNKYSKTKKQVSYKHFQLDKSKKTICYYTGETADFNGKNYKEKDIYGSEIAAINLCEKMASKYNVIILCNTAETIRINGVTYINKMLYHNIKHIDYFIISRYIHALAEFDLSRADNVYYIMHDSRVHDGWAKVKIPMDGFITFLNYLPKFKKVLFVSEWQKTNFIHYAKTTFKINLDDRKFQVINNGINPELFPANIKKIKNRFVYCSDPTRGLIPLCQSLIELQKKYKDITLDIYFGTCPNDIMEKYVKKYSFIKFHGRIPNEQVIAELSASDFWVYPNLFSHETFCISCLEAMKSGNVIITRDFSALPEIAGKDGQDCILIPRDYKHEQVVNFVIAQLDIILNDDKFKTTLQNNARVRASNFNWKNISKQWDDLFEIDNSTLEI